MGETAASWLVSGFSLFGIQFQNWMLFAFALLVLAIVITRRK
jgi:hypothetical protein